MGREEGGIGPVPRSVEQCHRSRPEKHRQESERLSLGQQIRFYCAISLNIEIVDL
jgi:hypothetical protein